LVLTTHRVRLQARQFGRARLTSILLSELQGCEISYTSSPSLLIIGGLTLLFGFLIGDTLAVTIGTILGLLIIGAYLYSRRQVMQLSAGLVAIKVRVEGMGMQNATRYIEALEAAKNNLA
jgi:hypothetical protein